ncbi:penicillin acylase family protein [Micromonosporaceae bacterium Da 78-11]
MTITWDDRGVPTITGDSELDVCHGFGYAQAVAQAGQVLELYGIARGRAAALWGGDFTPGDVEHAQLGLESHVEEWHTAQQEATLARLRAFCDGFNTACAEDPRRGAGRREVLPVTPRDVTAHVLKFLLGFARFWDEGLAFPPPPGGLLGGGSSAWAVTAERSSTGEAMLLINPHVPWAGPYRMFEARTICPGRRYHGIATLGFPWQSMGYGRDMGWAHTVNPIPQLWVYDLTVIDDHYLYDDALLPLQQREHTVDVRGEQAVTVIERRTVHGPVLTAPDGADVAIRIAGVLHWPATTALESWWQMSLATSVRELLEVQDRWPLPVFNILAADSSGSIAAAYCGTAPQRPGGRFDDSRRRLPGNDPAQLWQQVHPPGTLPRVIDPGCGWVQNVNETPWWFCEPPLDPGDYPDGIAPAADLIRDIRSPLSRAWLRTRQRISPEDLLELKWQTRAHLADLVLDDLLTASSADPDLRQACDVLQEWDRHADPASRGYPLFHLWAHEHLPVAALFMAGRHLTPSPEAGGMPTGLTDPTGAAESLKRAAATLAAHGHQLDVRYRDFATLGTGADTTPASGGPTYLGLFKCLELMPTPTTWQAMGGDTWVSLIRFTSEGPAATAVLVDGNITEETAPPHTSQIPLFGAALLRPLPQL